MHGLAVTDCITLASQQQSWTLPAHACL
jgi:hypothetical protein